MSNQPYTPRDAYTIPDDEPQREWINFGTITLQVEDRLDKNNHTFTIYRLAGTPINGQFTTNRTFNSYKRMEFRKYFIPAVTNLRNKYPFFNPPNSKGLGIPSDEYIFFAKWRMARYQSYERDDVKYYEENYPDKIETNANGVKFVWKTAFDIMDAYPNMADCQLAMEAEFPPTDDSTDDDIPGFDAPEPTPEPEPEPAARVSDQPDDPRIIALNLVLPTIWNGDGFADTLPGMLAGMNAPIDDPDIKRALYAFMIARVDESDTLTQADVRDAFSAEYGQIDEDIWLDVQMDDPPF